MIDALLFTGISIAAYYLFCVLLVWGLRGYALRKLRGPARKLGRKHARAMFQQYEEIGAMSAELEQLIEETREMGCGGANPIRYPPWWLLNLGALVAALTTAWLIVFA